MADEELDAVIDIIFEKNEVGLLALGPE